MREAGFHEVAINSGKRRRNNPDKQAPHTNIKSPKKAEVQRGIDAGSLEQLKLQNIDEVKMTDKNLTLIAKLMQTTFALQQKEVISDDLPVGEILEHWPALKMESQVKMCSLVLISFLCVAFS